MENCVLVKPNGNKTYQKALLNLKACEPPLWLCSLAKKYNTIGLIDAEVDNLTTNETVSKVMELKPDKVIILATGNHPSSYVQQREEMVKLEIKIGEKVKVEAYNHLPCNPVELGTPRLDLLDYSKYTAHNWHCFGNVPRSPYGVLFTSISCPFNCSFCAIKQFYGNKYSERPLEDIFKDLDYFAKNKVFNIKIIDELFVFKKQRVLDICNYIISNGYKFNFWAYARIDIMDEEMLKTMKKAGINWLAYGIEHGNDEIRKSVLKGSFTKDKIRDVIKMSQNNDIYCLGNYMFGFWEDNYDTMRETLDFAKELNCEFANLYTVVAYPNSPLYDDMITKGVSLPTDYSEYAQMSENFKPLPTKYLTGKQVLTFRDEAFDEYFLNLEYLDNIGDIFGMSTVLDIEDMSNIRLTRNYG